MKAMEFNINASLVSRLALGALSEHEQRMITARLVRTDDEFRRQLLSIVEPFEMFDRDLAEEYSATIDRSAPGIDQVRQEILGRSFARATDLEVLIRDFTVRDALSLGEVTRKLFSWSMAEYLLQRSYDSSKGSYNARTSLYLAMMVIDFVDLLGAAGHSPNLSPLVAEVRQRIRQAVERQES